MSGAIGAPPEHENGSASAGTFARSAFTRTRDCMALAWPARAQIPWPMASTMPRKARRPSPHSPLRALRGEAALGLLAVLAISGASCSLINRFDDVKTVPDPTEVGGDGPREDDCLDGIDNDGDGDIDCADTDCRPDYECAVAPVTGWTGPLYVETLPHAPDAATPDPCPDGKLPATYYAGPSPADCTPCDCTWTGAACSAPELLCGKGCDQFVLMHTQSETEACFDYPTSDSGPAICQLGAGPKVLAKGTCAVNGAKLTNPLLWSKDVRLCAAAKGGGCGQDKVCVKKAPANFEEAVCISQEGSASCPLGWLDLDLPIYGGGTDERACQGCTCSVDAVSCSGGKYTVNAGSGCLPPPGTNTAEITDSSCKDVFNLGLKGGFVVSFQPELSKPVGLQCGTSTPSGSVKVAGGARVCCRKLGL